MRILDKYILRELTVPLFFCLVGGVVFYLVFDLFSCVDDLQRHGAGVKGILLFNVARIPELMVLLLPAALLLALLYAISNHARYNEIVAMRAAGINAWRICAPYIVVGLLLGGLSFYLNEQWVPYGSRLAKSIRKGTYKTEEISKSYIHRQVNFANMSAERVWSIGEYDARSRTMSGVSVEFRSRQFKEGSAVAQTTIQKLMAEGAIWKSDAANGGAWEFRAVQLFSYNVTNGKVAQLPIPERYDILVLPEIADTPEEIESEIFITGFDSFKSARRANLSLSEISLYLSLHKGADNEIISKVKTLFHSRIASPFTCIVVVLVALPFGLQGGRRNVFVGVASSIVICFCFFLLNEVSLALGAGGYLLPWMSAWVPNFLFGTGGLLVINRLA